MILCGQNGFYQGMVGEYGRGNIDCPPTPIRKDAEYEHVGGVFLLKYADRGDLFEGLSIWKEEKYRELQGTYPVIALSFANVKETDIGTTKQRICQLIKNLYSDYSFLSDSDKLTGIDKDFIRKMQQI